MSGIREGDICADCGERVRNVIIRSEPLSGSTEITQAWRCGCDSLAGPQVARLKA